MGNRLYLLQYVGCLLAHTLCDSRHMALKGDMQQHLHTHIHTVFVKIIYSEQGGGALKLFGNTMSKKFKWAQGPTHPPAAPGAPPW